MKESIIDKIKNERRIRMEAGSLNKYFDHQQVKDVANEVLKYFEGLELDDIRVRKRTRELVIPRHISIFLLNMQFDYTLSYLGNFFLLTHHTSVIAATRSVEDYYYSNKYYREKFDKIYFSVMLSQGKPVNNFPNENS